jgi:Bacterial extracellular solute-binding proteins, family 5 Middle
MCRPSPSVSWVALLTLACSAARVRPPADSATPACETQARPGRLVDSLVVAVTGAITPTRMMRMPNAGERFVFAQAYETPVRRDCAGRLVPGLATSWRYDSVSTAWTIVLRDSARFWNGDPVTAVAVLDAWRRGPFAAADSLAPRLFDSGTAIDSRTIVVRLNAAGASVLADPRLAVARARAASPWPEGTGAYAVRPSAGATVELARATPGGAPRVVVHAVSEAQARDFIDAGVDLLLTDNRRVAAYAATRNDLSSVALPVDRTYVLAITHAGVNVAGARSVSEGGAAVSRLGEALARDAVGFEARPPGTATWWTQAVACGLPAPSVPARSVDQPVPRVVFRRGDDFARGLANRLAALAAIGGAADSASLGAVAPGLLTAGDALRATGLSAGDFATALASGDALGFIVDLPRESLAPCVDLAALARTMPWLAWRETGVPAITPLVDAYWRAFFRRDGAGFLLEGDGGMRLTNAPTPRRVMVP